MRWHYEKFLKFGQNRNLVSDTICNLNYIPKYDGSSSTLFGCVRWPLSPLHVMSTFCVKKKVILLSNFVKISSWLLTLWTKIRIQIELKQQLISRRIQSNVVTRLLLSMQPHSPGSAGKASCPPSKPPLDHHIPTTI